MVEGIITNFRRGRHTKHDSQMIVKVTGVSDKEKAKKLIGKKVSWKSLNQTINGTVIREHGNSGAVKVQFEKGMPGQAIAKKVAVE